MEKLRKIFAIGVIMVTVLSMSVVVAPKADAAASAGSLIKMDGLSSVYYLAGDGKRYVFPNESTYFSWYKDFSGVVTIPQSELESYNLGANVTVRPGTKLVKITTNPNVYAVEPGGNLRKITSEANAATLFGVNWAKRVIDVADSFFTNYKIGADLPAGTYPVGSLIQNAGNPDIMYFDGTNYRKIVSEAAFVANRFDFANVLTASTAVTASGTQITGAESALTDTSSGAGGTAGAGTGLTVAVSATTAPSGTIIAGQAIADLASFNLTAANDGAVKVTTIKIKRTGISQDSDLSSVYLYDGASRITDAASVSAGYITFVNTAGIVTVAAGTTKTITVKANIASGATGHTVGVSVNAASDITTDGASVSGSFPASGNVMSVATASLATVDFSTTVTPGSDGTPEIQNDFTMWQNTVTFGNRAVNLSYITFRQIGSVNTADLKNFKLYVDGIQVGSTVASMDANGYVSFDLTASPKKIETGSRTFKVIGDIVGGSTKTFSLSLRQASDVVVVDTEYNANVLATAASGTFTSLTSYAQTIASGNVTVTKTSDSPSGNIVKGASDVTLAKYTLHATGEPVKIETLKAGFTGTSGITSLRNGRLVANGVQIGSTASLVNTGTTYTVNYTVTPGADVTLEIHADIYDTASTTVVVNDATTTAKLIAVTSNAQGVNSLALKTVPSTDQSGNQLTIKTGSISLAKTGTYGNQTVVVPQSSAYKIGSFVLSGNSTEDVNLNTIAVDFTASGTTFTVADLSDAYVKYGSVTSAVKSTVGTGTSTWSISYTLAKNANLTIELYAKIGSTITATDALTANMIVSGTTASSGAAASTSYTTGQVITAGAGSITSSVDASSATAKIVVGNQTADVAAFKFSAVNDAYTITEVTATSTANGATNIVTAYLKDGSATVATQVFSGTTVTFSGISIPVSANSTKVITVALQLNGVGSGAGTSGANISVSMTGFKANNSQGVQTTDSNKRDGNNIYVYKSIPTITNATMPSGTLTNGSNVLGRITVSADAAGNINWKKLMFTVTKSANPTMATTSLSLVDETNTAVTGTFTTGSSTNGILSAGSSGTDTITFIATNEQSISSASPKTYSLKVSAIGGTLASGDNVTTNITQPSSYAAPAAYASGSASFVWSDNSANNHDTTTADWNNDYLVKNLPSDSQVLSK